MEKVLIILENPLVVAIITTGVNVLFNYLDKWILNYNIKKDQARDKKIAYISEEIVKTRFGGYGSRNIEKYLLELECVLDLCGKHNQYDYIYDGHIWKIIEDIKRSSTETEFEKNKQILIQYLTLAKNKGNQKQRLKMNVTVLIVWTLVMDLVIGFIYISYFYFIFNIKNIMFIFGGIMTVILMCTACILLVRINMDEIEKSKVTLMNMRRRKIAIFVRTFFAIFCFVLAIGINYVALSIYAPNVAVQNMLFSEDNDKIYIYTEQKMDLFESLRYSVEKETGKKVEFVSEKKELPTVDKDTHSEQIVAKKMRNIADEWGYVICFIIYIMMFSIIIRMMNKRVDLKVYTNEIRMINYTYNEPYQEKTEIADDFINKAEQYRKKDGKKYRKDINKCFEIAFGILEEQSWAINKKIKYQEKMIENVEDYDELKLLEENLESVNEKMKEIKLLYCKSLFLSEKNTKK